MSKLLKFYENIQSEDIVDLSEFDLDEVEIENVSDLLEEPVIDYQEERRKAKVLLEAASDKARDLLQDAKEKAIAIHKKALEDSKLEIARLEDEALRKGYQIGFEQRIDEITKALQSLQREIRANIQYLKQQNDYQQQKSAEEVKFLAIEIASKILHKRIEMDPADMQELVNDAVLMAKKSQRIHIEMSSNAVEIMNQLEKDIRSLPIYQGKKMHVECKDLPIGSLFVECDMGIYDLSISTQLENLLKIFKEHDL